MSEWQEDLEQALFALLPKTETGWSQGEETYDVERALEEQRGQLYFVEIWNDPRTHRTKRTWRLPIEAGAFAGIPAWLLTRTVATLLRAITEARPQPERLPDASTFDPSKFAQAHGQQARYDPYSFMRTHGRRQR